MINKNIAIIVSVVLLLLSAVGSYFYFAGQSSSNKISMSVDKTDYKAPSANGDEVVDNGEPKTEECPMNGKMYGKSQEAKWEKRRPLGIMVENSVDARPQSGLSNADIIYEAVAEGGITRFLNIFYCQDAKLIGPVRSARIYFMRMLQEYGNYPLYAHVGGANCDPETGSGCQNGAKADALGTIQKLGWAGYNDMNQFSVPFPVYYRDYDRLPNVATEHTMYSSTPKLWDYAATKRKLTDVDEDGKKWNTDFRPWKFKEDAKPADLGTVNKISFGFWNSFASDFAVEWDYDKATNSYNRMNGGKPHIDKNTGKQLNAKNIVIFLADESPANDGYAGGHILYDVIGSGDMILFQDGKAIKGTWNKKDETARTIFKDAAGKEVQFNRGQIFVEIIPTGNKVEY